MGNLVLLFAVTGLSGLPQQHAVSPRVTRVATFGDLLPVINSPWARNYELKTDGKNQPWLYNLDSKGYQVWIRPPGWESLTIGDYRPMPNYNFGVFNGRLAEGRVGEVRSNDARFTPDPLTPPPIRTLHGHDAKTPCGPNCPRVPKKPTPKVPLNGVGVAETIKASADAVLSLTLVVVLIGAVVIYFRRKGANTNVRT